MSRIFDEDLQVAFGTRAVHAGQRPDPASGAIMVPIYQTSTYVRTDSVATRDTSTRGENPTREALERNIPARRRAARFRLRFGMGCLDSIMKLFKSGDDVICAENR